MQIQVLMLKQDDPKKCTAARLVKFDLAKKVKRTTNHTIILDPFATTHLLPNDKQLSNSITAIDCSWNLADDTFSTKFSGIPRKLPPLFAGNPVNYSKLNKLTTVEAISGALFILRENERGLQLLDKFKWGHTFYDLNKNLLNDYSSLENGSEIASILGEYGISLE